MRLAYWMIENILCHPLVRILFNCLLLHHIKTRFYQQSVNVRHNKAGEADEPAMYRINDDLVILPSVFMYFEYNLLLIGKEKFLSTTHILNLAEGIFG